MLTVGKVHAFGNDFLYVPTEQVTGRDLPALARAMCARHEGLGADGLILYGMPGHAVTMRLLNADGSPSELSGNGVRGLAALVMRQREIEGQAPMSTEVVVLTDAGERRLSLVARAGSRYTFRAAMGAPSRVQQVTLDVDGGHRLEVVTLDMGNPQCVHLVHALPDEATFTRLGPALATHPAFPEGTNVEFAVVEASDRVRILIWERGVGPTLSSGTGSCAAAVAAAAFAGAGRDVEVVAPGGSQRVEWRDEGVYLTGWAEVVFEGAWLV
jgi:diaminopimelate epimerase